MLRTTLKKIAIRFGVLPFVILGTIAITGVSFAQEVVPASDDGAVEPGDIIVTARKKSENILKTPVAITAFGSGDLQARGIGNINEMSTFTPGLKVVTATSGRNDRSFQQIVIRGFTPSSSTLQTTSMFIDGVPVSTSTAIQNLDDPERIEVLKGPQSAYFGRQTFAGAINVVTKDPPKTFGGSVTGMIGTHENHDVAGEIGGPLIGDLLSFRASVRDWSKKGSYRNVGIPTQTLGDQSTRSGSLALEFKPSANFTAKAFGMLSSNKDGPNATGLIAAYTITNPNTGAVVVQSQSNCAFNGFTTGAAGNKPRTNQFVCGVLPNLLPGSPSMNSADTAFITDALANPTNRVINPKNGTQGYGLRSRYYHLHAVVDWAIPGSGITLSSLTGYNNERKSELSDLDLYYDTTVPNSSAGIAAGGRPYFDYPFMVEYTNRDFSQELRASLDNHGPFRLTIGGSYLNAFFQGGGGGNNGNFVSGINTNGATKSLTYGAFYGAAYDITRKLTINFDGRYQIDRLLAYARPLGQTLPIAAFGLSAGFYPGNSVLADQTFKNFMPRVIVNYQANPNTLAYASFSQGVNPGQFNTVFLSSTAPVLRAAIDAGFQIAVNPEKLNNYEVGVKGKMLNNRIRYAIAAYYANWTNQINQRTVAQIDPGTGLVTVINAAANGGMVNMKGIEAEVTAYASRALTFNLAGAINDTDVRQYTAPAVSQLTGITDFSGKQMPLTSKYSATASIDYSHPIGSAGVSGFARVDFTFKSGVYTDIANIVRTPDMNQVNVRLGITTAAFTLEGYVTNLFNNRAYGSAVDTTLYDRANTNTAVVGAVAVALRELRTIGVRARYSF
jgi:iron complex outermembrane receptor protein